MIYSQRDERWKDETLGTKGTIEKLGCTITALGMVADLTPSEVNQRLKDVDGYAEGNLIIWSKIKEAISWLEWEWRGWEYDNEKVKQAIEDNGFCLVEVDASRIGAEKHWVVYIGDQQMLDPWYGNQKSTNYYRPTGYSVINKIGDKESGETMYKGLDLTNKESMKVAVDAWERLKDGELVEKEKLDVCQSELESANEELGKKRGELKAKIKQINELKSGLADKEEKIVMLKKDLAQTKKNYEEELSQQNDFADDANRWEAKYNDMKNWVSGVLGKFENALKMQKSSRDRDERVSAILTYLNDSTSRIIDGYDGLKKENEKLEGFKEGFYEQSIIKHLLAIIKKGMIWKKSKDS